MPDTLTETVGASMGASSLAAIISTDARRMEVRCMFSNSVTVLILFSVIVHEQ